MKLTTKKMNNSKENALTSAKNVETQKNVVTTKNEKIISSNTKKGFDFNNLLNSLSKESFSSCNGLSKENIYKNEVFADCITDRDKKTLRRKIRNLLENCMSAIMKNESNSIMLKSAISDFDRIYQTVYRINDYSLQSLTSANTNDTKKANLKKMLEIIKKNK